MQLSVRNVAKKTFKEFKARTVEEGVPVGTALTLAMEEWLERRNTKRKKYLELKPWDWGTGTERTSKDIDKIVYG
ncbi:MAG: hypothetical protein HYW25_00650 [Candidatus Aenigmarchaeota archaeon]|nr:hypothetical protein [Candidatus Aenigmarchaeota archaeon]